MAFVGAHAGCHSNQSLVGDRDWGGSPSHPRNRSGAPAGNVSTLGLLAVFLAAVGVYGVISYSVARRTSEIGIRVALGAQRRNIFGMIIRHGLRLAGLGIFIGVIAALGMARILGGFLYEVSAADPLTYVSVSAFLIAIAMGASYFPARRAAAVNPLEALRIE